jgi:hypothetical protein
LSVILSRSFIPSQLTRVTQFFGERKKSASLTHIVLHSFHYGCRQTHTFCQLNARDKEKEEKTTKTGKRDTKKYKKRMREKSGSVSMSPYKTLQNAVGGKAAPAFSLLLIVLAYLLSP